MRQSRHSWLGVALWIVVSALASSQAGCHASGRCDGVGEDCERGCGTSSACDGGTRVECVAGDEGVDTACEAGQVCVSRPGRASRCALADELEPRCDAALIDSYFCDGDVATRCYLGYPVARTHCEPDGCAISEDFAYCRPSN